MTKEEIFNYFYTNSASLTSASIVFVMLAALVIALLIFITYRVTHRDVTYNAKFNMSLVATLLISVVIMLMISSNIVISLGMVGALSIVRFRTAIKDSRDTVFMFWAITEGLCIGSQNFQLAIITTLFIASVFMVSSYLPNFWNKYLLVITGGSTNINMTELQNALKSYTVNFKLKAANKNDSSQEMIFEIRTKGSLDVAIMNQLLKIKGVESANWIAESGDTLG